MDKSRTQEQIFNAMHRELRAWNKDMPEAVERMDPVMRLLLQLYAHQLEQIDKRIDQTWDVASSSLLRSMVPECRRWAVPAHTVMHCRPTDPVVDIDTNTRFYYQDRREGGETFYFSFHRNHRLVRADLRNFFVVANGMLTDHSPPVDMEKTVPPVKPLPIAGAKKDIAWLGIEFKEHASNFADSVLFFDAEADALNQLRWGEWSAGKADGTFDDGNVFVPGVTTSIDDLFREFGKAPLDWGGLRTTVDLYGHLEDHFVMFPQRFTTKWEIGQPPRDLVATLTAARITPPEAKKLYWIRIELPPGGDRKNFHSRVRGLFNCFVATNRNEQTLYKHSGGNRLVDIDLPDSLDEILGIDKVNDSRNEEYVAHYDLHRHPDRKTYSVEERGDRLVLWFEFPSSLETPPDSITVTYSVTSGVKANGISKGEITDLYENHPGIESVVNVLPVKGAVPAKTMEQILVEVSARLRSRDRALSFDQIGRWVQTFDPRIVFVECENGVQRAARGVVRCIVVKAFVRKADFYSSNETELIQTRLSQFLKSRAPVNTRFQVEIVER